MTIERANAPNHATVCHTLHSSRDLHQYYIGFHHAKTIWKNASQRISERSCFHTLFMQFLPCALCLHCRVRKLFPDMHCYVIAHRLGVLYLSLHFVIAILKYTVFAKIMTLTLRKEKDKPNSETFFNYVGMC